MNLNNDLCPCGSGKKLKKCCGGNEGIKPNSLCPCGSGKKYKNCCGKENNLSVTIVLFITAILLSSYTKSWSQTQKIDSGNNDPYSYEVVTNLTVLNYKEGDTVGMKDYRYIRPGNLFDYVKTTSYTEGGKTIEYVAIRIVPFEVPNDSATQKKIDKKINLEGNKYVNYTDNHKFLLIKKEDFENEIFVRKRYHLRNKFARTPKLIVGTLILPVKIRPKMGNAEFSFTTDVSLGASVGMHWRINPYQPFFIGVIGYFGTSLIKLDSTTTNGIVTQSDYMAGGLTAAGGLVFDLGKYQIGVVSGADFIPGEAGRNWMYRNKPWFSIGLGYQFLKN